MAGAIKPQNLGSRVAAALGYNPSKQQVANVQKSGSQPANATKQRETIPAGSYMKQRAGNPNRSYPVSVVNKARAKMGGH